MRNSRHDPNSRTSPAADPHPVASPVPRRIKRARWWDIRVIGGVLLLALSVFLGATLIGSSQRTTGILAATGDLAAGTVLTAADVTVVHVNVGDAASRYVSEENVIAGKALSHPVRGGELLPVGALEELPSARLLALSVPPDGMPPGVQHGSVVDIYLTTGTGEKVKTLLLSKAVPVQSVLEPSSGALSGAVNQHHQVAIQVSAADAERLVGLLPTGSLRLVLLTGGR